MPAGRPSDYTPEKAALICGLLAEGKSLRTICKPEDMPSTVTVYKWLRDYPEFLTQYMRAREDQADALFEETIEIADCGSNDWMEQNDPENPGYKINGEHIQRSRLRVDTRKWAAGKLAPKKYGDKQVVGHQQLDERGEPSAPSDSAEIARRVAFLLNQGLTDK